MPLSIGKGNENGYVWAGRSYPDPIVGRDRDRRWSLPKRFAPASRLKRGADAERSDAAASIIVVSPRAFASSSSEQTLNIYSGMPPNMCLREERTWFREGSPPFANPTSSGAFWERQGFGDRRSSIPSGRESGTFFLSGVPFFRSEFLRKRFGNVFDNARNCESYNPGRSSFHTIAIIT